MYNPHAYTQQPNGGGACAVCGCPPEHSSHNGILYGMDDMPAAREQARAEALGEDLTAKMRQPKGSISAKAGRMEQWSPLFAGTDANPQASLF